MNDSIPASPQGDVSTSAPVAVVKREGQLVAFDASKIEHALGCAGAASGEFDTVHAAELAKLVALTICPKTAPNASSR